MTTPSPKLQLTDDEWRKKLTPEEFHVLREAGTERPGIGEYTDTKTEGVYECRACGAELFRSSEKFESHCGWPSFDDQIPGAVKRQPDADGFRVEIICASCGGHLGHVFEGERLTSKNTRYCVNSISMDFVSADRPKTQRAVFAAGCFWGVERKFWELDGVWVTAVGYAGGYTPNATYEEVCTGQTGHNEVVRVVDGGEVVRQALDAGLVDELTVTLIPRVLGAGVPLFAGTTRRHDLELLGNRPIGGGLLELRYRPLPAHRAE